MRLSFLIAVPMLVLSASCVPHDKLAQGNTREQIAPAPAPALLKQLDLTVPADLAHAMAEDDKQPMLAPAIMQAAPATPFLTQTRTADDATRAVECLTAAIYYEARSESDDGKRAVAQVVLNRVRDRAFPSSVCGVVYQGSHRSTGCQFSFTCDGSMNHRRDEVSWENARAIATQALAGQVYAPVGSATFYHANYVSPWWANSMSRITSIGAHIFYRWRTSMERALAFRQTYSGDEPIVSAGSTIMADAGTDTGTGDFSTEMVGSVTIHRAIIGDPAAQNVARAAPAVETQAGIRVHRAGASSSSAPSGLSSVALHYGSRAPETEEAPAI